MTVLITGGCGFIGSNFIRYWLKKYPKDKIINIDKLTYAGHLESTNDFANNLNYRFVNGDICDKNLVNKLTRNVDLIVHFAAESHVDRSIDSPDIFIDTNIKGTLTLLKAALSNKVKRFHHVSTDEVFGSIDLKENRKFDENTKYNPRSIYSASKAGSDHLVNAYYYTYGLPTTITSGSNNYGPYQDPEKFIPRMITNLINNKKIPIYGTGDNIRDWLHVSDHCVAIDTVIKKGRVGETYVVGGTTKDVSNLELAKMVLKIFGLNEDMLEFVIDRKGHDKKYSVNFEKIKKELNWEPKYTLEEGLKETIRWYKENKGWWKPLKGQAENFYKNR